MIQIIFWNYVNFVLLLNKFWLTNWPHVRITGLVLLGRVRVWIFVIRFKPSRLCGQRQEIWKFGPFRLLSVLNFWSLTYSKLVLFIGQAMKGIERWSIIRFYIACGPCDTGANQILQNRLRSFTIILPNIPYPCHVNTQHAATEWWWMEIASDVVKAIFHTWKLDMNFIWSSDWLQWTIYEVLCPSQEVEPLCVKTTCEVLHELREPPRTPISMYHHYKGLTISFHYEEFSGEGNSFYE